MTKTNTSPKSLNSGRQKAGVREVAAAAGLSVATVSRVINKGSNVSEGTRLRVLDAMRDLGFTLNPMARALATHRTRTIGAVIPTLENSIFARFLDAVEQTLAEEGYALVIATSGNEQALESSRAHALLDMGAEGLILSGATHAPDLLETIVRRKIPTLCTSIYDPSASLPTLGYDNKQIGSDAIKYLQNLGHTHIAIVHGPVVNNDRTALRTSGVKEGASEHSKLRFFETTLDVSGGTNAAKAIFAEGTHPTAVLCLSDVLALGIMFETDRQNIRVPDELSVMGFDNLDWASVCEPGLTTVRLPTARMGRKSAGALIRHLDGIANLESECIPAEIIVRGTVGPPVNDTQ